MPVTPAQIFGNRPLEGSMCFTTSQFAAAVESCPEVQRLRSIEAAAVAYRDAFYHVLFPPDQSARDAWQIANRDARKKLFDLLTPQETP
ncbi:MAG: hypothetical protein EHM42_11250 [Planctomycetaceae bacterium]|nr:MAG: hypothetical protein EHM42_11250 [Planctomycetaceae bacterium]